MSAVLSGIIVALMVLILTGSFDRKEQQTYPEYTPYVFEDCVGGFHRWYTLEGGLVVTSAGTGINCPGEEGWK